MGELWPRCFPAARRCCRRASFARRRAARASSLSCFRMEWLGWRGIGGYWPTAGGDKAAVTNAHVAVGPFLIVSRLTRPASISASAHVRTAAWNECRQDGRQNLCGLPPTRGEKGRLHHRQVIPRWPGSAADKRLSAARSAAPYAVGGRLIYRAKHPSCIRAWPAERVSAQTQARAFSCRPVWHW